MNLLFNQRPVACGEYPKPLYTNNSVVKGPIVNITESTIRNRMGGIR